MNDMQIFKNDEFGAIRTVVVDGEAWFVGKDVVNILGYQNGSRDINRHVDEEDRQNYQNGTFESNRGLTIINESGLYSLILSSHLESAKRFILRVNEDGNVGLFEADGGAWRNEAIRLINDYLFIKLNGDVKQEDYFTIIA